MDSFLNRDLAAVVGNLASRRVRSLDRLCSNSTSGVLDTDLLADFQLKMVGLAGQNQELLSW